MSLGRTTPELLNDVVAQVTGLFRTEVRLVKTEIGEKVSQAISGVVLIAVGAVLLLGVLFLLLSAAVDGIVVFGLARWLADLIVGGVVLVVGVVLILSALRKLSGENLVPKRTFNMFSRQKPAGARGSKAI